MQTDREVLRQVADAFGATPRPLHFHVLDGDPEAEEHEALLQSRTLETLSRHDLRVTWDPLCGCSPQGLAYLFPALARIALEDDKDPWDWYAQQLLFHLDDTGSENEFLRYCNVPQRQAVVHLLEHIRKSRAPQVAASLAAEEIEACIALWRGGADDA